MATAADAAREFATGPQVIEAVQLLLNRFPLPALCEALAKARPDEEDHLLATLERLAEFEQVRDSFLSDKVVIFLQQGANANDPRICGLVAKLLSRLAKGGETAIARLANLGLLDACEHLILVEETATAEAAGRVLCAALQSPAGSGAVLGNDGGAAGVVERLHGRLRSLPDVQRIRALHLFVDLGRTSTDAFVALERRGIYREVLGAFLTEDILLKLNAVELMDALGSFPAGQDFLTHQGIPDQLAQDLCDPMCDGSVRLCVVRLLGFVLRRAPEQLSRLLPNREAPLAQTIAGLVESTDPAERLCSLNAWANISMHSAGLAFFLQWEGRLQTLLALVTCSQNEVCKGAMSAWAMVLQDRPPPSANAAAGKRIDESPDLELWEVAEKRLLPLVLKNLKAKPFPDVRSHVWHLLALLARSRYAAQQAVPSAEVRDLLLDFTSETTSDARIAKHTFIVALLTNHADWLGAFLDEKVEKVLAEYARQGPHWVPRQAAAMVGDQAGS